MGVCGFGGLGFLGVWGLEVWGLGLRVGSIPHLVMGSTKDFYRRIKDLLTPYLGAITVGGIGQS